jgi:hypothetical protein
MAHYCCAVLVQKVRTEVRLKDQYCLVPSLEENFLNFYLFIYFGNFG